MAEAIKLLNLGKCENKMWLMSQELKAIIDKLNDVIKALESATGDICTYAKAYSELRIYEEAKDAVVMIKHPQYWLDLIGYLRQKVEKIRLELQMEKQTIEEKRNQILGELINDSRKNNEAR